jgi:hypothetical protein
MSYEGDEGIPLAPMGDSGPAHEQMRQRAGHVVSLTHDRPRRTGTDQSWISYLDAYQGASMLLLCTPPPNQPTHHCHLANVAKLCPFHHQSWSVMGHSTTKQNGCVGPCPAIAIGHYVRTPTHPSKPVPVLLSNLLTAYTARPKVTPTWRSGNQIQEKSEFETFNFNTVENEIHRENYENMSNERLRDLENEGHRIAFMRWMFCFTIAVAVGLTGFFTDLVRRCLLARHCSVYSLTHLQPPTILLTRCDAC